MGKATESGAWRCSSERTTNNRRLLASRAFLGAGFFPLAAVRETSHRHDTIVVSVQIEDPHALRVATDFTDVALSGGQITCDLNKLTSDAEIAVGAVPGAAYSQVGLVIQSVSVYIDNDTVGPPCAASIPAPGGRSAALSVPNGEIPVPRNFDVKTGGDTVMRLNFNTEQSIRLVGTNSFTFTPFFSVVSVS